MLEARLSASVQSVMNYEMKSKLEGLGRGDEATQSLFRGTSCVGEPQVSRGSLIFYKDYTMPLLPGECSEESAVQRPEAVH